MVSQPSSFAWELLGSSLLNKQARTYYGACLPRVSRIWIGDDRIGFPVGDANKPEDFANYCLHQQSSDNQQIQYKLKKVKYRHVMHKTK